MSAVSIEIPSELVEKIDKLAGGSANRTHYLLDLIEGAFIRQQQISAIKQVTGAWSDDSGAEWAGMESSDFVSMLRNRPLQSFDPPRES